MRKLVVAAVAALSLVSLAPPAGAQVFAASAQGFEYAHTPPSPIGAIAGNITCTAGQRYVVRVNVVQDGQKVAVGKASGVCTGSSQSWQTNNMQTNGNFDCAEPFVVRGIATTPADGHRRRLVDNVPNCLV